MSRARAAWGWVVFGALIAGGAGPGRLSAQQRQEQAGEKVDSTRLKARALLQTLARPLGADSTRYLLDSLAQARLRENRPAGTGGGGDSTLTALMKMRGYALTEYQGAEATYSTSDHTLTLIGEGGQNRASVTREGTEIQADSSITYNEGTRRLLARGNPTVTPGEGGGSPVESKELIFDMNEGRGTAIDAKTTYDQAGAKWIVDGNMPWAGKDSVFMSHGSFTSCDLEVPHYHFETDQIKIIGGKVLVARPVRLYFADVPVAWLPFIAQSLSRGRASGILTPRFSVNDIVRTSGGYHRRISNIGYYWAMSQYTDLTTAMDWFSDNWLSLESDFRYSVTRQFLNGNVNVRRYWRSSGSRELSFSTNHSWQPDERTQLRVSANYTSNTSMIQQNSFDPQEVTRSIRSDGGLNRRFNWGSMSMSANRYQYLSDDRVEWTLPSASLNLSTITLFKASPSQAHFWNNMTWSGSANAKRTMIDRVTADTFSVATASSSGRTLGASSNLSMGNLTFSQNLNVQENMLKGVPNAYIAQGPNAPVDSLLKGVPVRDIAQTNLSWSLTFGYQQQLIGSTTLTPSLGMSGTALRSDTATNGTFVYAPARMNLGASLKTDIYGFWPGVAGYQAIRHKLSPSFSFSYSPSVQPSPEQSRVFHQQASRAQKTLAVTLRQTFEAKGKAPTDSAVAADTSGTGGGPRQIPKAPITTLLALSTSVVNYDFMEADSLGFFLAGFRTTQLQNQISSDFLRGLNISMTHDLFDDQRDSTGRLVSREFKPHLSQLNFAFSLGSQSKVFKWLGLIGGGRRGADTTGAKEPSESAGEGIGSAAMTDEASIIPTSNREPRAATSGGGVGGWRAQFSYSLQRPRDTSRRQVNQMLQINLSLKPTEHWDMHWRTSYDIEAGQFNDHSISLSRDLHRWQANFDFLQTATGNWTFRFEVSLKDNRDLKLDYSQRNQNYGQTSNPYGF